MSHAGAAPNAFVRISGLCYAYGGPAGRTEILRDASMELKRGEVVALLGRSGSGKSTLLNLISGIDRPDSGSVEVAGVEVTRLGERDRTLFRRRHIGFVYQFFNLIPTLTVRENVALALELNEGISAATRARVADMLAAVGLEERGEHFPDQLSGGEQQRTAIARALIHRPTLVLADEPTGNLDAQTSGRVMDRLLALAADYGAALLMVTHHPDLANLAHRVFTLEEGRPVLHQERLA